MLKVANHPLLHQHRHLLRHHRHQHQLTCTCTPHPHQHQRTCTQTGSTAPAPAPAPRHPHLRPGLCASPAPGTCPAPPKPAAAPVFESVYFDVNKTNINPAAAKALDQNAKILKENPNIKVEIGGHTDSGGSEQANQVISEKRAQSAKKYIQDKFNIPESRMVIKGYGSQKPIADDKTKEGQAKNRRVEFSGSPIMNRSILKGLIKRWQDFFLPPSFFVHLHGRP